ncbi:class II glutamine amidotransferase [Kineobactrum sediminis]|uniref:Class II glutamine amidotransferase n=1 Tax=Kineobactrum sediminis TaxID=1905677 RepID=A0A2N5XYG1_9GAMM|nr:class II glutamine amidotransferase [Kineobactrum sediminis]PLW81178.1 class II glutamine amidotransferase [Kineobactrum sediminis]
MCRMVGFIATHPTALGCTLVEAPHSLLAQSSQDLEGFAHADGWGIAQWGEDGVSVMRHLAAAHEGEDYRNFAGTVRARQVIAHVRQATAGDICFENTHPFVQGPWVFVHNGTIRHFREQVKARMWPEIAPDYRTRIRGTTDSEVLFQLLLTRLDARPEINPVEIIATVISDVADWCAAAGPCENLGLSFLLSDGERFFGVRWQQTLWMLQRTETRDAEICGHPPDDDAKGYRALLVASEPLTDERWLPIPEYSVFEVEQGRDKLAITPRIHTLRK